MDSPNKKPNSFLLTTKLDLKVSVDAEKKYLGEWVIGAQSEDKKKEPMQRFHWEDKLKKNEDYKYIISLYEKILKEIRIRLNKKLCINKSER